MKEMIESFFHYFIHPVKSYRYLRMAAAGLDGECHDQPVLALRWSEVICLSWFLYSFVVLYDFAGINLGSSFFMTDRLPELLQMKRVGSMMVIQKLFGFVFFPLFAYIGLVVNRFCMRLMLRILGYTPSALDEIDDLLAVSMAPSFLLLIPAFGVGLHNIGSMIYRILGARHFLSLSWGESILVGMSSFFLLLGLGLLFGLTLVLIGLGLSL